MFCPDMISVLKYLVFLNEEFGWIISFRYAGFCALRIFVIRPIYFNHIFNWSAMKNFLLLGYVGKFGRMGES